MVKLGPKLVAVPSPGRYTVLPLGAGSLPAAGSRWGWPKGNRKLT